MASGLADRFGHECPGRDAADTAFLLSCGEGVQLDASTASAVVHSDLPFDDLDVPVRPR